MEEVVDSLGLSYNSKMCTTARELRDMDIIVPDQIPDCGWVPNWSMVLESVNVGPGEYDETEFKIAIKFKYSEPFRWAEGVVKIDE